MCSKTHKLGRKRVFCMSFCLLNLCAEFCSKYVRERLCFCGSKRHKRGTMEKGVGAVRLNTAASASSG